MCIENEGVVNRIAEKYRNISNGSLSKDDFVQVGMLGMLVAAYCFDSDRGYRFSTYATWWIRQFILKEIRDNSGERELSLDSSMSSDSDSTMLDYLPDVSERSGG